MFVTNTSHIIKTLLSSLNRAKTHLEVPTQNTKYDIFVLFYTTHFVPRVGAFLKLGLCQCYFLFLFFTEQRGFCVY